MASFLNFTFGGAMKKNLLIIGVSSLFTFPAISMDILDGSISDNFRFKKPSLIRPKSVERTYAFPTITWKMPYKGIESFIRWAITFSSKDSNSEKIYSDGFEDQNKSLSNQIIDNDFSSAPTVGVSPQHSVSGKAIALGSDDIENGHKEETYVYDPNNPEPYIIKRLEQIFFPEEGVPSVFTQALNEIWLLDDSSPLIKLQQRVLLQVAPNYTIRSFSHTSKAIAHLKEYKELPYAVITDLHMHESPLEKLIRKTNQENKTLKEGVLLALFLRHIGFKGLITAVTAETKTQIDIIKQIFITPPGKIPVFDEFRGKLSSEDTIETLLLTQERDAITGLLSPTNVLIDLH